MKNQFAKVFVYSLFAISISCNHQKENGFVFKKEESTKKDAVKEWLYSVSNYKKSKNYLNAFYNYYNKKIKEKDYVSAAEALDRACILLADSYDFNVKFMATVKVFDTNYRKKVPATKGTFVDAYLANYFFDKYDLKKAISYFEKVTKVAPNDYNSCYNVARAYYDISYIHYITGKQNESLLANQKSLEYFSKIDSPKGFGFVYSNYANIYTAIGDKKKAIVNLDKAIKTYERIDNTYNVYIGLINKIATYEFFQDQQKKPLIDSVYQAYSNSKDESKILKIKIFGFKVENLVNDNKLAEAKKILEVLKPLVNEVNSEDMTHEYKVYNALFEIKNNPNYIELDDIKTILPTLITNQQYEKVNMFLGVLKQNAILNNDYKTALKYIEEKKSIGDSIGSIATREKVIEFETKFQTEKKVQQIAIQEKIIANKNTTIAWLAFLFLGLFVIILIYHNQQKQKKLQLEKQSAQNYTKQLLEKTEEERKRIASDLHDSVSHELLSLKNLFEKNTDETNSKIDAIINDIRIISRNLHPVMFDKIGLKESIIQLVERTQQATNFMVTADIEYTADLLSSTELQIYRIVQEALTNIIKYANAEAAKITISEDEKNIYIEIKDNGKGFDVAETLANNAAFGLHNIIERSRAVGGEAKIRADKNGTVIKVEISKS